MRSRDDAQTRTCDSTYRIAMMSPCTPSRPDAKSESTLKPFVSSAMPSTSQHAFFPAARMRLTWSSSAATSRWDFSIAGHARKPHRGARRRALPSRHIVLDGRSKLLLLRGGCLTSRGLFARRGRRPPRFKGPLCPPATASVSPVHPVASRTRLRLRQSPLAKRFINTLPIWVNIGPESELVPGHRSEGWATCLRRFWRGNRSLAPISVIAAGADSIRTTEKNKGHGLATVPCGPTSKQMDDYTLFGRLGS